MNDQIEIKLLNVNPRIYFDEQDKSRGFLRWILEFGLGQKEEIEFAYEIKIPRGISRFCESSEKSSTVANFKLPRK